MNDLIPLAIWPHHIPDEQMAMIRQAKARLNLPYRVSPSPAAPGSPGRILALGALPPWPHDHVALVKDPTNAQSIENALRWLLTAPEGAPGGFGVVDYFTAFLGPVEDLGWIEDEQKVRFAND